MKRISCIIFLSAIIIACNGEKEGDNNDESPAGNQSIEIQNEEMSMTLCDCVEIEKELNKEMSKIDYNDPNIDERLSTIQDKFIEDIEKCEKTVSDLRNKGLSEQEFNSLVSECN